VKKVEKKKVDLSSPKKVLFVATVDSHIELFHLPYLKYFKDKKYEVHVATDSDKPIKYCDKKIKISIARSPFKLKNLKAIKELKQVIDTEKYDIIHCHTPMGGVVARLAAKRARKNGTRVIYTAHGFHFYKGAPILNWILFYPVEKYLAKYTDTLITINDEDYKRAKRKFKNRCNDIEHIPGVGVDEKKFKKRITKTEKTKLRKSLGLSDGDFVMICVGRLDKNKNQGFLIKTTKKLVEEDEKYHLLLVGPDELNGKYQKLANKLNVEKYVHFLGKRDDIPELLKISDVTLSSSRREGLPVNLIESAFSNVPIVATRCRGNSDVVKSVGGSLVSYNVKDLIEKIVDAKNSINPNIRSKIPDNANRFNIENVRQKFNRIYSEIFGRENSLSIIIPFFNAEDFISSCIDSILKQPYFGKVEIILINDGSTDSSIDICRTYQKKHKNIKIVNNRKNQGVSEARNIGIKNSNGEYLYFVDADDILLPRAIKNIIKSISKKPDIISGRSITFKQDKNIVTRKKQKNTVGSLTIEDFFKGKFDLSMHTNIIKKELITKNKIKFDNILNFTEDMDFMLNALSKAKKITRIETEIYGYRRNSKSVTSRISKKRINDMLTFIERWKKRINNSYMNPKTKKKILDFLAYQLLITCGSIKSKDKKVYKDRIMRNIFLLDFGESWKTVTGKIIYKTSGYNTLTRVMQGYLTKVKGVR